MTMTFYVLLVLPSMVFAFLVLSTFYGARRAYLAICWIPLALFATLSVFQQLRSFDYSQGYSVEEIYGAVRWASLVQACIGLALAARAIRRGLSCIELIAASCLAGLPFFLRI